LPAHIIEKVENVSDSALKRGETGAVEPESSQAPPAERSEHQTTRRRRKRRRRGRKSGAAQQAGDSRHGKAGGQPVGEPNTESTETGDEPLDTPAGSANGPSDRGETVSADRAGRGHRRRSEDRQHKGSARHARAGSSADEDQEAASPEGSPPQPASSEAADASEAEVEELDQEQEDYAESCKTGAEGHRGIPHWEEAISYIINKNLEARAKKPDAGSSRTRGGGRRRD